VTKSAGTGLTKQQKLYCEARARGERVMDAAREAGAKHPNVYAARWDKMPAVKQYIAVLKRAGAAFAAEAQSVTRPVTGDNSEPVTPVRIPDTAPAAVATIGEAILSASQAIQRTDGRKIVREYVEEEALPGAPAGSTRKVSVQVTDDGIKAREQLIRHYDQMDAPKDPTVTLAVVLQMALMQVGT
jgi:hypothetical protein